MAEMRRLFVVALDGRDPDEHIFSVDTKPDWHLYELRQALKDRYYPTKMSGLIGSMYGFSNDISTNTPQTHRIWTRKHLHTTVFY